MLLVSPSIHSYNVHIRVCVLVNSLSLLYSHISSICYFPILNSSVVVVTGLKLLSTLLKKTAEGLWLRIAVTIKTDAYRIRKQLRHEHALARAHATHRIIYIDCLPSIFNYIHRKRKGWKL